MEWRKPTLLTFRPTRAVLMFCIIRTYFGRSHFWCFWDRYKKSPKNFAYIHLAHYSSIIRFTVEKLLRKILDTALMSSQEVSASSPVVATFLEIFLRVWTTDGLSDTISSQNAGYIQVGSGLQVYHSNVDVFTLIYESILTNETQWLYILSKLLWHELHDLQVSSMNPGSAAAPPKKAYIIIDTVINNVKCYE